MLFRRKKGEKDPRLNDTIIQLDAKFCTEDHVF